MENVGEPVLNPLVAAANLAEGSESCLEGKSRTPAS